MLVPIFIPSRAFFSFCLSFFHIRCPPVTTGIACCYYWYSLVSRLTLEPRTAVKLEGRVGERRLVERARGGLASLTSFAVDLAPVAFSWVCCSLVTQISGCLQGEMFIVAINRCIVQKLFDYRQTFPAWSFFVKF